MRKKIKTKHRKKQKKKINKIWLKLTKKYNFKRKRKVVYLSTSWCPVDTILDFTSALTPCKLPCFQAWMKVKHVFVRKVTTELSQQYDLGSIMWSVCLCVSMRLVYTAGLSLCVCVCGYRWDWIVQVMVCQSCVCKQAAFHIFCFHLDQDKQHCRSLAGM